MSLINFEIIFWFSKHYNQPVFELGVTDVSDDVEVSPLISEVVSPSWNKIQYIIRRVKKIKADNYCKDNLILKIPDSYISFSHIYDV